MARTDVSGSAPGKILLPGRALLALGLVVWGTMSSASAQVPIIDAARDLDRTAITRLVERGVDVNAADPDGTTALHWAAHHGDLELVETLLGAGARVNAVNNFSSTPLGEAAAEANTELIRVLLEAGADPDVANESGQTPLMVIARNTNVDAARLLLEAGADPDLADLQSNQTALHWAAAQRQGPMVRLLLEYGAAFDRTTSANDRSRMVSSEPRAQYRAPGEMTPLLFAAREGCLECVRALVEAGADIDLADPERVTPLIMATWNTHWDTASYLLSAGADPNKFDYWGRTPLYLAVDYNTLPHGGRSDRPSLDRTRPLELIEQLLEAGADPNIQLKVLPPFRNVGADRGVDGMLTTGATPLLRAAKAMDAPAIALLVGHGARLDIPNRAGTTPMMAAAGVDSTDADTRGWYHTSDVEARAIASLELLLDAGGDVNQAGGRRTHTPLHGAAFWGWNDVVEYLVSRGADVNAADPRGMTPLDAAMGRAGGNSRGGQRIDVFPETAALVEQLGGRAGTPAEIGDASVGR